MGNTDSSIPSENIVGYQVIYVAHHSPAEKAGLCPYFDFVLSMDDIDLTQENRQFFLTYISRSLNQPLKMNVYSLKTMKQRLVTVIPRSDWTTTLEEHDDQQQQQQQNEDEQHGNNNNTLNDSEKIKQSKSTMHLGCSIRYESVKKALNCVWHVIGVKPDSPAERASISSDGTDYIVGYDNRLFSEPNELTELLSHYQGISASSSIYLSLFIYNWKTDSFRHVVVNMSDGGHLGIELGTGYLHIIPPPPPSLHNDSSVSLLPPSESNHLVSDTTTTTTTTTNHNSSSSGSSTVETIVTTIEKQNDDHQHMYHISNDTNNNNNNKEDSYILMNEHGPITNVEIKEISTIPNNSNIYSVSTEETNAVSRQTHTLDINVEFYNSTIHHSTGYSDEQSLSEIIGEEN